MRTLLLLPLLTSCVTLDFVVHNPVHCSTVDEVTCSPENDVWDDVCLTCEEPYDWTRDYPWMPQTLDDGERIRAVATEVETFRIPTDDGEGELDAYFIPSHGEVAALANTTIVYNHGNYAGIEHYAPRARMLHEAGYNVFIWDYRGYGKSLPDTAPSPDQFMADAQQVRRFVNGVVPDTSRIVVYANSLGAIPAVEMAVRQPGCALLLEAPFTSMSALAASNSSATIPETFFSEGHFDNIRKIEDYEGPVFAMVGDLDNKFPVEDIQRLVDAAPGPSELWVLPGVRHGIENVGVPEDGFTAYTERMQSFLEQHAADCLE
ncbi:MAG: alpha/beta hydrolase [Proteobacteria bacterium]|nr:alpha/beta hydrolase [Pseudomonadota bacterium]